MPQCTSRMAAARPSDLKRNNRTQILEFFRKGQVCSVAEIAGEVGISRQTVMKAVQFFLEKGIIVSEGKADSGSMGGKRAELFSLSPERYLFSLLSTPDGLQVSLFNLRCEVLGTCTREITEPGGPDGAAEVAAQACFDLMRESGVKRENVYGVCVVTPGITDRAGGRVRYSTLFPSWGRDIPLAEKLGPKLGGDIQILVENVSKVCGCAYRDVEGWSRSRAVTVFSGWDGVGACLMHHGRILIGKDSLIGEIGHMRLATDDEETCGCGSRGCFERQVSGERIRGLIEAHGSEYPGSPLLQKPLDEITIGDMFAASEAGDGLGRMLSGYTARFFALALHNLTLLFNPESVVLQGDYAAADTRFMDVLFEEMKTFRYYGCKEGEAPFDLRVDGRPVAELAMLGAYTLLIDRLFSDETTYS